MTAMFKPLKYRTITRSGDLLKLIEDCGILRVWLYLGLDDAFVAQDRLAKEVGTFEELLIPDDFSRIIPEEYAGLPRLTRRATVEFVVKKADGSKFDVDGVLFDRAHLQMVVDGFNAPITAGNFVDLVDKGFYKNMQVQF